ncbi:MAG: cobalamin biosynthesis protein [Kineosporiaceae bacterium]
MPAPSPAAARALGLLLGVAVDAVLGDPRRAHPVAAFGRAASWVEQRVYGDSRPRGVAYLSACVVPVVLVAAGAERAVRERPWWRLALTAAGTWVVVAGTGLAREGASMATELERGDLAAGRARLRNLCAREATSLDADAVARATVESLAENTSDAVVAPLVWGAVAGLPGLLGYRAVNTLDAMVGYHSPRYERFGWAAARLDDVVNLAPARLTALLTVAAARSVGGSASRAWRVWRRDGHRHPSPNAGHPEAAAAGALGVRLGGRNVYDGYTEDRAALGEGPPRGSRTCGEPSVCVAVTAAAAAATAAGAWAATRPGGALTSLRDLHP